MCGRRFCRRPDPPAGLAALVSLACAGNGRAHRLFPPLCRRALSKRCARRFPARLYRVLSCLAFSGGGHRAAGEVLGSPRQAAAGGGIFGSVFCLFWNRKSGTCAVSLFCAKYLYKPARTWYVSIAGDGGVCAQPRCNSARKAAMLRISSGVVRQQPPIRRAPAAYHVRTKSRYGVGLPCHVFVTASYVSPVFG